MINLIPPQGRKALNREYILRAASVCTGMVGIVFLAATTLLIPTYVYINTQVRTIEHQNIEGDKVSEDFKAAEAEVKFANTISIQLSKDETSPSISNLIAEVIRIAPPGIFFKNFELNVKKDVKSDGMQVQGMASSRASLLTLKQAIEESALFESAILPISDLARDVDLPFSITVVLPNQKSKP